MRTVIVYESMYGATRTVADELAAVAREHGEVLVLAVSEADGSSAEGADLVLVGGPTHLHGMSWSMTREAAVKDARAKGARTEAAAEEPSAASDAEGPGLRDWFHKVGCVQGTPAAAFDTRLSGPAVTTGRASRGIARRLRHHGFTEVAAPRSFLVDRSNQLVEGERERAREWAGSVLGSLPTAALS